MYKIINKCLLVVDKFMSEIRSGRLLGFTYGTGRPFAKNKERIQKFNRAGDSR